MQDFSLYKLLNYFVYLPDNKLYSFWKLLTGIMSLISCMIYSYVLAFGLTGSIDNWDHQVIIVMEIIFLIDFILCFFVAFDEDGFGEYITSFRRTKERFINSKESKVNLIVLLPLGYIGLVFHSFGRIFFFIKLQRIQGFLYIFEPEYYV